MAAAASAPGREEGGGGSGGGGRREEGGSEKPRGPRRRRRRRVGGVAGAEQSGADPAPSLRLGARARPRPRLPALGGAGGRVGAGGGKLGRSFHMPPREPSYEETPMRRDTPGEKHAHGETFNPRNTQGRQTFSLRYIPYVEPSPLLAATPSGRHSHGWIVSTGTPSPIRNSPLTLKIIPKTDGL